MQLDEAALERLATDRVRVRRLRDDDLAPMLDALRDPEIYRWVHQIPFPYSEADGRWFLELARTDWEKGAGAHLAIEQLPAGGFCGLIAITKIDNLYRSAWMGYWIEREHRGRGIVTEAARVVVRWAFESVGLERLSLTAEPDNEASQRVARKCGFTEEGLLRSWARGRDGRKDSLLFSLLPSDPRP